MFQDLTVSIRSDRSEAEVTLLEDESEVSGINVQSFVDEQEWKLHSFVDTWKRLSATEYAQSRFRYPIISTSCRASRRPGFFLWNILFVMVRVVPYLHSVRGVWARDNQIPGNTKSQIKIWRGPDPTSLKIIETYPKSQKFNFTFRKS